MLANCSDTQAHAAAALQFFHASEHLLRRIVRHTRYKSRFLSPVTATDEERESSVSEVVAWLKEYGPLMDDEIATVTTEDGARAHRLTEKGATRLVERLGSVIRTEIEAVYKRQREIEENKQRARLERRRQ